MTKEEMKKRYSDKDLELVSRFLTDYVDLLETTEPYATDSIAELEEALSSLPSSMEEI